MNILHLDACLLGEASASRQLVKQAVEHLFAAEVGPQLLYRELGAQPLAYLMGEVLVASGTPDEVLVDVQRRESALDAELLTELLAADVLVISAPIYSFSVLTGLKAWIDRLAIAASAQGLEGNRPEILMKDKKAVIVAAGANLQTESTIYDAYIGYLKELLGFIGIGDIEVEHAEAVPGAAQAPARPAHGRRPTRRSPRDVRRMHQRQRRNGCKDTRVEGEPEENPVPGNETKRRFEVH